MGVYIKGMEMPQGDFVEVLIYPDGRVNLLGQEGAPVFDALAVSPHGRLADIPALYPAVEEEVNRMRNSEKWEAIWGAIKIVDIICEAPTIIPAESEG